VQPPGRDAGTTAADAASEGPSTDDGAADAGADADADASDAAREAGADECAMRPPIPPPPKQSTPPVVQPLDVSAAVPNPGSTFGIAAQGGSGDFLVGVIDDSGAQYLVRYHADGTLDTTFATAGVLQLAGSQTPDDYFDFEVTPSGPIVVEGLHDPPQDPNVSFVQSDVAFRRYAADGTPDATFGSGGFADLNFGHATQTEGGGWALTDTGDIVLTQLIGTSGMFMASYAYVAGRVTASGAFDPTFGTSGKTDVTGFDTRFFPSTIGAQPGGAVVFAARDGKYPDAGPPQHWFHIVRLTAGGLPDKVFGDVTTPPTPYDEFTAATVLPSGKILAFGSTTGCLLLDRFEVDGKQDTGFGNGGRATDDLMPCAFTPVFFDLWPEAERRALVHGPDGGFHVAGGYLSSPSIYRMDVCGVRDALWGNGGISTVQIDPSFKPVGSPNAAPGDGARFLQIARLPDGHVLATGTSYVNCGDCTLTPQIFVVRFDPAGVPDPMF